jgi:hypothetical protein
MPFLLGTINRVFLTIFAVFMADALTAEHERDGVSSQRLVNWDVAAARPSESTQVIHEGANELQEEILTR